jgi:2'-5' RNA ligase
MFVAARVPDGVRAELARWSRTAVAGREGVRRLTPETLHITLCFLGEQPLSCVGELAGLLGGAAEAVAALGELATGPPLWLPPRRPRALAVEIGDPGGALGKLRARLAAEIAATIGWASGRERFRPHVTVARVQGAGVRGARKHGRREFATGADLPPTPQLCFVCDTVALLRSHLEPSGARYEELASVGGW